MVDPAWVTVKGAATSRRSEPCSIVLSILTRPLSARGMQLDINPDWPVLATYDPATPDGLATPSNGAKLLAPTVQGPGTFFEPS